MVFGYSSSQCAKASNAEEQAAAKAGQRRDPIATLGSSTIYAESVEKAFEQQKQQFMQMQSQQGGTTEPLAPGLEASSYAQAVVSQVTQAVITEVAKENGVIIADDAVRSNIEKALNEQLDRIKAQLISDKKLQTGASEADFDAALQKNMGISLAKVRTRTDEILADPVQKQQAVAEILQKDLLDKMKSKVNPSEDDVKKSTATMTVHRIFVSKTDRKVLDEALEAIKKGMKFEDAVNKYSQDPKFGDGKLTDNPRPFMMTQAFSDPGLADMKNAKAGFVSKVCEEIDGFAVYKVVTFTNDLKDYEKDRAKARDTLVTQLANAQYSAAVKAKQDKGDIAWKSAGFKALYEVGMALAKLDKSDTKFQEVLGMGGSADDMFGRRAMAYAKYFAMTQIWQKLDEAGKTKQAPKRIEVLQGMLEITDSPDLRLDMVDCFIRLKDKAVAEQLALAANNNFAYLGATGKLNFDKVVELSDKAKAAGLLDAKGEAEVLKAQDKWKAEYKRVQDEISKQKAEEEKMRKQAEEENKKAEAEAKKQDEAAKKQAASGRPGEPSPAPPTKPLDSSALGGAPSTTPPASPSKPGG
jgi:hypothetical protein